jgi:mRNA interferase HigB
LRGECTLLAVEVARGDGRNHGDFGVPLDVWYRLAKSATWKNLLEVRQLFPTADRVGEFTLFNVKGNAFRLVTEINYKTGKIFIRQVLTLADYSKGGWKL